MSKPPTALTDRQQIYADLMDEARIRIHAIRDAIDQRALWTPRLLQEFVYLQLRMLCETIAVGCLVAHGDVTAVRLLKLQEASKIMNWLDKINPDCYPRGVRFIKQSDGSLYLADHNVPQLTRRELSDLWNRSGTYLHRGTAKSVLASKGQILNVNLDVVIKATQKILNLLEQHIISSFDRTCHLLVALSAEDAGGNAMVAVAQGPRPTVGNPPSPPADSR
jgi:hypothetical protein